MKVLLAIILIAGAIFYFYTSKNNQTLAKVQLAQGQAFLENNKTSPDIHTTDSGLQYQVLTPGTGTVHPKASDTVTVNYEGRLIDGTVFDSSFVRGEPISFPLTRVIKGWTEGLQLMVAGEKVRFFIPSNLAYGNSSAGQIPAGSTLIFDVELISID
ncbi:FKBP-type peptidyl-prolyl cis-trans isomerase [Shewanella surugensis]|uniref:Peptidyl-prolyl cis-trans isomerase n=1 Tax=Shewanella surugensis TaxID=212020 RepID=A0ABT0L8V6_9GAMM|nr:FKBP-type peptidyl-prolyl cis-trans isomerase [Shewanella surugensis]MCL1123805.1 FKBP-type peptidyl-prolyl cis-trans isomerase [Shewanella surugensis]